MIAGTRSACAAIASCVELEQYVHCRNCPVYSAAALTLLDRELPPEHLAEWTAHFAGRKKLEEPDTHSAIIFRIASEWFALSTLALDEVAEPRTIHSLPHLRSSIVLGLVNVRGELLICVSLAKMLRLGETTSVDAERKTLQHQAPGGHPPQRRTSGVSRRRGSEHPSLPSARLEVGAGHDCESRGRLHQCPVAAAGQDRRLPRRSAAHSGAGQDRRMTATDLSQLSMHELFRAEAENQTQAIDCGPAGIGAQSDCGRPPGGLHAHRALAQRRSAHRRYRRWRDFGSRDGGLFRRRPAGPHRTRPESRSIGCCRAWI